MVNQNQFPKRPIRKKRRKQEKKFGNNNRKKLLIVFIVLLIFICVLIGRLLYINLSSSDTYARIVMAQMDYDSKSIPLSGETLRIETERFWQPVKRCIIWC